MKSSPALGLALCFAACTTSGSFGVSSSGAATGASGAVASTSGGPSSGGSATTTSSGTPSTAASSTSGATSSGGTPDAGPHRLLFGVVNTDPSLFVPADFAAYLSAWSDAGIHGLHVYAAWRERCFNCGSALNDYVDIDTEPTEGTFDFSDYFASLDIGADAGFRFVLSFILAGALDSATVGDGGGGPNGVWLSLPPFIQAADTMEYRGTDGGDFPMVTSGVPLRALSFEDPTLAAKILAYVDAVVEQFGARYGDAIVAYTFPMNFSGETEYPLNGLGDTSPAARAGFQTWLATKYATPAALSTAWGHTPALTSFADAQILDGQPPPAVGSAPQAYLDFMAYREVALGAFLQQVRQHVQSHGGRAMAQYGSVFDTLSATRGSYGFAQQVPGFDLVVTDDAPSYDHLFSGDLVRSNVGGIAFGGEADSPCIFACSGSTDTCCIPSIFPKDNNLDAGMTIMGAEVDQAYETGATYVGLANWDNFQANAFQAYAPFLSQSVALSTADVRAVSPGASQPLSLLQWYMHHDDQTYLDGLIATHADLADAGAVKITVTEDLY